MKAFQIREDSEGCTFAVHVAPGSGQDAVVGLYGDALRVRLKAPPVEGKANQALRIFLAEKLGVPVAAVEIRSGHTSRRKTVHVAGITAAQVRALVIHQAGKDTGEI